jgi:hypothetical protein
MKLFGCEQKMKKLRGMRSFGESTDEELKEFRT